MIVDKTCNSAQAQAVAPGTLIGYREVARRVANRLRFVSTLLGFQARWSSNPEARDALAVAVDRIFAVAGAHRQRYWSKSSNTVHIASYSLDLTAALEPAVQQSPYCAISTHGLSGVMSRRAGRRTGSRLSLVRWQCGFRI
ncbi:histidine kinase dimerization/phosphoacceptor domain -containing protein [Rhizobium mayense]|uniref:histidine kinase dimerization/phosphoacceptor domain -containing protein n=1 Tax=Rhizobium mayense TaxID=1312184 RepID=UPI003D80A435